MRNFFLQLRDCKQEIVNNRDREAAGAYSEVVSIIKGLSFSSYKKAQTLVSLVLDGNPMQRVAEIMGISEKSAYNQTIIVSNELFNLFGNDFLIKLKSYKENKEDIDSAIHRAKEHGKGSLEYIIPEVVSLVSSEEVVSESYDIMECSTELTFLATYSKKAIRTGFKECNKSKLRYLLNVLDGKAGTTKDWASLTDWLGIREGE